MTPHNDTDNVGNLFGLLASGLWALIELARSGAPSWSLVPPILFGVAAVWNARTNARKAGRVAPPCRGHRPWTPSGPDPYL